MREKSGKFVKKNLCEFWTMELHEFHLNMKCDNLLTLRHSFHMDQMLSLCYDETVGVMYNTLTKCEQVSMFIWKKEKKKERSMLTGTIFGKIHVWYFISTGNYMVLSLYVYQMVSKIDLNGVMLYICILTCLDPPRLLMFDEVIWSWGPGDQHFICMFLYELLSKLI